MDEKQFVAWIKKLFYGKDEISCRFAWVVESLEEIKLTCKKLIKRVY
jgi:hypothetical protein